jgi:hypothetical protein
MYKKINKDLEELFVLLGLECDNCNEFDWFAFMEQK